MVYHLLHPANLAIVALYSEAVSDTEATMGDDRGQGQAIAARYPMARWVKCICGHGSYNQNIRSGVYRSGVLALSRIPCSMPHP